MTLPTYKATIWTPGEKLFAAITDLEQNIINELKDQAHDDLPGYDHLEVHRKTSSSSKIIICDENGVILAMGMMNLINKY